MTNNTVVSSKIITQSKSNYFKFNPTLPNLDQNFLHNSEFIQEGDTVIIYVDAENILSIVVKRGNTCSMKKGALRHEFLIGKR